MPSDLAAPAARVEPAAHSASALRLYGPMLAASASLLVLSTVGSDLTDAPSLGVSLMVTAWLFVVILWGAVGVMLHAEAVAHVLGEPLGTLVLTLSAITVELALILSVMLVGEPAPTLARDTMFAVLMIVVNGLLGIALLLGGFRHRQQTYNLEGARSFLVVLTPLAVCAMALPNYTTSTAEPTLSVAQSIIFGLITLTLYGVFLALQTSRHRAFFAEEPTPGQAAAADEEAPVDRSQGRRIVLRHSALLLLTLVPVALLAHHMAEVLEVAGHGLGTPPALVGVIIATLILAPEGLAALRAAWDNHLQRAVNILLGSALSTIGLTVPAVLIVGVLIGHEIVLGLQPQYLLMLALTLLVASLTFGTSKTDMLKGAVHVVLFGIYLMLVMLP